MPKPIVTAAATNNNDLPLTHDPSTHLPSLDLPCIDHDTSVPFSIHQCTTVDTDDTAKSSEGSNAGKSGPNSSMGNVFSMVPALPPLLPNTFDLSAVSAGDFSLFLYEDAMSASPISILKDDDAVKTKYCANQMIQGRRNLSNQRTIPDESYFSRRYITESLM
jgi:hypothetical protein